MQSRQGSPVLRGLGGGELGLDAPQLHVAIKHVIHCQTVEHIDFLPHVGDAPIGWQLAVAAISAQFAAQQGEQGGFAGAIGSNQPDLVAGVQGQFGALQQSLGTAL
ncbi:hypothetical protein STUTZSP0542_35940 [Stutzerimonas marianensis]